MGGGALGVQAHRLSTPQLDAFEAHSHAALAPFFLRTLAFRPPGDKVDHGDLDLLCAYKESTDGLKGADSGYVDDEGHFYNCNKDGTRGDAVNDVQGIRKLCFEVTKSLDGFRWTRGGSGGGVLILSIGVPSQKVEMEDKVIPTEETPNPFFQVDLLITSDAKIDFSLFSTSYGTTLVILSAALKMLSPVLKLHMTHLEFRYLPYLGLPQIRIQLTNDPEALAKWLGLDYEVWKSTHFHTEKDLWKWLIDIKDDTVLAAAWRRVVKGGIRPKDVSRTHKRKIIGFDLFAEWLQSSDESRWAIPAEDRAPILDQVVSPEPKSPNVEDKADQTKPSPGPAPAPAVHPLIDPERPAPLYQRGLEALKYWGVKAEFDQLMEERKMAAEFKNAQQQKNLGDKAILTALSPCEEALSSRVEGLKVDEDTQAESTGS